MISISPYVLHRRRGLWDDPDAFDPSRFLGERRERIDRFAYIPFGAGPRVCIGMPFAIQEAIIILANLLRTFRFGLVAGHPVMPQQRVTLRPRGGMKMHVRRREARQISTAKISLRESVDRKTAGPYIRAPPTARRALEAAWAVGFGNFSSALLPAERRGRRGFVCFLLRVSEAFRNSGSDLALQAVRLGVWFDRPWGIGFLLFDNCIGRKRDVGGVVLA